MGYRQVRKFSLLLIIALMLNFVVGLSMNVTNGTAIGEVVVNSNLISVSPQTFTVGSVSSNIINTKEYTTPSGGKIRVDTRPAWINQPQIIYDPNPTTGTDSQGNIFKIYHAVIPFEYDFNIYSSFDYKNVVGGYEPSYSSANGEESKVVIGRGYQGDILKSQYQVNGWRNWVCVIDADRSGVVNVVGTSWKPTSSVIASFTDKNCINNDIVHGNDGIENFQSTLPTKEWYGYVPYVKIGASTLSVMESDIDTVDFNTQKNYIASYTEGTNVDIGSFGVNWKLKIAPPIGMTPTFDINGDGSVIYNLNGTWVNMKEVIVISNQDRKGLVSGITAGSTENFILTQSPNSAGGITTTGSATGNVADTKGQQGSGMETGIQFQSSPNPISSTIELSDRIGGDTDYSLGDPIVYSIDKKKNLIDFNNQDFSTIANYTDWEIQMNGFNCQPAVQIYKKMTAIDYKEQWYDIKGIDEGKINRDHYFSAIPTLAGWEVYNTFIHQRIRASVDVYSKYIISVSQTEDREELSTTDDPENPIGKRLWDNSNYNVDNYDESQTDPFQDWLNSLSDFFTQNSWIIWLILGIVGVVIIIYLISLVSKYIPKGITSDSRYQRVAPQIQIVPVNAGGTNQDTTELLRQIRELREQLNQTQTNPNLINR